MKKLTRNACLIVLGMILVSCAPEAPIEDVPTPGPAADCGDNIISYERSIQPIMARYCSDRSLGSCHGTGSTKGDLTTFTGAKIFANNGKMQTRVITQRNMPPSFSAGEVVMTNQDLNALECWLAQGAKNN